MLLAQMNNDRYVSLDVIAAFKRVQQLTTDRALLVRVARQCATIEVDDANTALRAKAPAQAQR